jgi:hypothetical protein
VNGECSPSRQPYQFQKLLCKWGALPMWHILKPDFSILQVFLPIFLPICHPMVRN